MLIYLGRCPISFFRIKEFIKANKGYILHFYLQYVFVFPFGSMEKNFSIGSTLKQLILKHLANTQKDTISRKKILILRKIIFTIKFI